MRIKQALFQFCTRDKIETYVNNINIKDNPPFVMELLEETKMIREDYLKMIQPSLGKFLAFLIKSVKSRNILELGTFTGYSTSWILQGSSPNSKITTVDRDREASLIAQKYISRWKANKMIKFVVKDAKIL